MQKVEGQGSFLGYVHLIRGVAIVLIVASHIYYGLTNDNAVIGFLNATVRNSTVIFLFISGFLFQHLLPRFKLKQYYLRKLKYVVFPYLTFSALIIGGRMFSQHQIQFGSLDEVLTTLSIIFGYLLTGSHLLPFWYIPVIIIFFITAPLWAFIDRKPKLYWIIPLLILVSVFIPRDSLNDMPKMFAHFTSVYVIGMFFSHYRGEIYNISDKYRWAFTVLLLFVSIVSYIPEQLSFNYWWTQYLKNLLWCWGMFYWFQKWNFHNNRLLEVLAQYSFGIYFIHFIFCVGYRFVITKLIHTPFTEDSFIWVPVYIFGLIFVLFASYISLFIIKKVLKQRSRVFIGS